MPPRIRAVLTPLALMALELLHEGPTHPYEMHQIMRTRETGRLVKLAPGSLYHTVERLAEHGLIEVVETSREGRRPERTSYRITDAGRDAFAERLREIVAEPAQEFPIYHVGISMLHTLDRDDALVQLHRRQLDLTGQVATAKIYIKDLTRRNIDKMYWVDVYLKLAMAEAELTWTTQLTRQIEDGELTWPTGPGAGQAVGEVLRIVRDNNDRRSGASANEEPAHDSDEGATG
ncbi:MAG TPA: PadR family transcriptional regulator [Pseudonocardiaceae bacterium]|jgi:DNA-binding PadR family transcriptional regulator|nr:PadR family transcriptional regulator [Pseudonocardiaceae bacterium]